MVQAAESLGAACQHALATSSYPRGQCAMPALRAPLAMRYAWALAAEEPCSSTAAARSRSLPIDGHRGGLTASPIMKPKAHCLEKQLCTHQQEGQNCAALCHGPAIHPVTYTRAGCQDAGMPSEGGTPWRCCRRRQHAARLARAATCGADVVRYLARRAQRAPHRVPPRAEAVGPARPTLVFHRLGLVRPWWARQARLDAVGAVASRQAAREAGGHVDTLRVVAAADARLRIKRAGPELGRRHAIERHHVGVAHLECPADDCGGERVARDSRDATTATCERWRQHVAISTAPPKPDKPEPKP
eukprot:365932-Chlamydomonas_euryale.AAC.15